MDTSRLAPVAMASSFEPESLQRGPRRPRIGGGRRLAAAIPLLLLASCGDEPHLRVGPVAFHQEDLRGLSPELERTLAALAALGLVVAEDRVPEVAEPLAERAERRELRRMLRHQLTLEAAGMDEEDLRDRYRESPDYELVVRHILKQADEAAPESEREDARRRAERARERALDGEPFEDLAAQLSQEPGADRRGGRLDPGREGTWVDPFWEAALELEEGEVSEVVETSFGFHVIRLEERRTVPFEEVRGRVLAEVADEVEAGHAWDERLARARDEVTVDEPAVASWPEEEGEGSRALARWDDGVLTAGEFGRHAATLEDDRHRAMEDGGDVLREEVREAALERLLAEEARGRGLRAPVEAREEAVLAWRRDAAEWAGVLGFREGVPPREVQRRSLEALGATGQAADLARRGVVARFPLLRHSVAVERPEDRGSDGR